MVGGVGDSTWVRRCVVAGESGCGKIHGAPEEVDRAGFADKSSAKCFENAIGLDECLPEIVDSLGVVACVGDIVFKGDGRGDFYRTGKDLDVNVECVKRTHGLLVKGCDSHGLQGKVVAGAIGGCDAQGVIDEIEVDAEGVALPGDG